MQSHTVSDHEVVFLNERTARKRSASVENPCAACARPLLPGHDYCSLFCKVKRIGYGQPDRILLILTSVRTCCAIMYCTACVDTYDALTLKLAQVKHLGESEHELRRALRVSRQEVAPTPEPQTGRKRSSSSSDAGPSCGGSFRKRSRKQAEPAQAPFH